MKIAVVNDARTQIPGTSTLWDNLIEWLHAEFVGNVPFSELADRAATHNCDLLIRNGSYFGPISTRAKQISIIQDVFESGPHREMQKTVIQSSDMVVFNSAFTESKYFDFSGERKSALTAAIEKNILVKDRRQMRVIPLPVDFNTFRPGNTMGLQQALGLPDGCVCWVGASQGAAGHVKWFDVFLKVVRLNPDIPFVAVFKDAAPELTPPNMRCYVRLPQDELAKVIGACRVGLCTSRTESQHLAGIEMGACGLPMVAPTVGVYWKREDLPGTLVMTSPDGPSVEYYAAAVRATLARPYEPETVRAYWQREFDRPVIKAAWEKLVEEVENSKQDD